MKFCDFLKKERKKRNLSQKAIVSELMLFDNIFTTLTVISFGRWERGVAKPTIKKMLLISKFFDITWQEFFFKVQLKLTKTQTSMFDAWKAHFVELGSRHNYIGYNSPWPNNYYTALYNHEPQFDTVFDSTGISKIRRYESKVMGLSEEIESQSFLRWLNSGRLFTLVFYTKSGKHKHIEAHSLMSTHPQSDHLNLIECYRNNENIFDNSSLDWKMDGEITLFIHSFVVHEKEWIDFVMDSLIAILIENWNITKLVYGDFDRDSSFRAMNTFQAKCIAIKENPNYQEPPKERIMEINSIDFLSQHGIVHRILSSDFK